MPKRNVVPKPAELSFAEAACLSTAWLTAYRMLFTKSRPAPGPDGARAGRQRRRGHGVHLDGPRGRACGCYATARTEDKQARALELGAHEAFASGARLPERVDAVMETVGEATWSHSLKSLKPGGRDRHLRRDVGPEPAGRPEPVLLPAAASSSARRWARRPSSPT